MIDWNKHKILLVIFVAAAAAYLIYWSYSYDRVALLKEQIKAAQSRIDRLEALRENLPESESRLKSLEVQIKHVEDKIPDYDCSNEFARELYGLVSAKRLYIDEIRIDSPVQRDSLQTYRFLIEASGSLDQVKQLVRYMNNHKRKLVIRTFSIRERPDNTFSAIMSVELYHTID